MRIDSFPDGLPWAEHSALLLKDYQRLDLTAEAAGALDLTTQLAASPNRGSTRAIIEADEEIRLHGSTSEGPAVTYPKSCLLIALEAGWVTRASESGLTATEEGVRSVNIARDSLGWPAVGTPADS